MNFKATFFLLNLMAIGSYNAMTTNIPCSSDLKKLDCLPGQGWDSLRNIEMERVVAITYDECKTTLDGKYLLPDHVFAVPLHNNELELFSEIIDHWYNYTSTTSRSIGAHADISYLSFSASGSFSSDYLHVKHHQVEDKSVMTRVSARYSLYKVDLLGPNINNINPELANSFYEAIDALIANNTEKARLILELIVRDYGTHVVTRTDAGAIIVKEDFILRKFVQDNIKDRNKIAIAAGVSFSNKFSFGGWYKDSTSEDIINGYSESTTSSRINTIGGDWYRPNSTVDEWISTINNNLASIDKFGDPLYFLIASNTFPNVSSEILFNLRNYLAQAITDYYLYNSHTGCMDIGPNFDFNANIIGKCENQSNNFTFGGVYQICTQSEDINVVGDLCNSHKMNMKNELTGNYSCQHTYQSILLKNGKVSFSPPITYCNWWWFHFNYRTYYSEIEYSTYWCAAVDVKTPNTGTMFGGLFNSKNVNPVTRDYSCPISYAAHKILQDLSICLSDDYELGIQFSINFGGFFSCQNGNALYDIKGFKMSSGNTSFSSELLKACPKGYTQHVAADEDECMVHYCVLADSFRAYGEMPVVLPPFRNFTRMFDTMPDKSRFKINFISIFIGFISALIICGFVAFGVAYWLRRRREYNTLPSTMDEDSHEDIGGETNSNSTRPTALNYGTLA